ncbi:MAG: hypothetical protein ACREOI_12795 [bacterium]
MRSSKSLQLKTPARWLCLLGLLSLGLIVGCALIDPIDVENPQTTREDVRGARDTATPFLAGVQRRFSNAMEQMAYFTDVVSDNYDNVQTFISPEADKPTLITPRDLTLNGGAGPYFEPQELRALAEFAISAVVPSDASATAAQKAEFFFYAGMAYLLLAENFGAVPVKPDGPPVDWKNLPATAIGYFDQGLATSTAGDLNTRFHLAKSRAYRLAGNAAQANAEADLAIAGGPANYVFNARYDPANDTNTSNSFAVTRALNDMQPLPRLDFLDPKYIATDTPIPVLKMEEAHLIKAEVALAANDLAGCKTSLINAVTLAKSRGTSSFRDTDTRTARPGAGTVKASATAGEVSGLIVDRKGATIQVALVSNTSLAAADVNAPTTGVALMRVLYLARQEIFFFEGRRMSDLGLRLPMMEREIETNPTIAPGSPGTVTVVPSHIPAADEMDKFSVAGTVVTILHDMNQVIADKRVSPFQMPF